MAGTLQHRNAVQFSGDAPWDAGKQSGKSPFYDSYDAYAEHMNNIGKGYSILPEYRMSERMEDYLLNGVDKFNDTKLLNLTGALANVTSSGENEFYKKHTRQRTTFNNDFWRDNRLDRKIALTGSVFGFRKHNLGEGTYTSSLWPLDARLDFINTITPGVKTARHDVFDDSNPAVWIVTGKQVAKES